VISFLTEAVAAEHAADLRRRAAAHLSAKPYEPDNNPHPVRLRPARPAPERAATQSACEAASHPDAA
jgi:hypothetical protein